MTPEAVAQPKADYLAIDHFSPLSRSPQIRRVAGPWSAATDARDIGAPSWTTHSGLIGRIENDFFGGDR